MIPLYSRVGNPARTDLGGGRSVTTVPTVLRFEFFFAYHAVPTSRAFSATPHDANVRAERLLKTPAEPSPELRIPGAAAQTRVVSLAGIRLNSCKSVRSFKGIICVDISEFESYMPSHAVGSL
jgi:hypothetical protein